MPKQKYYAWLRNDQGATLDVALHTNNKNELKRDVRGRYGEGWEVHIMAVDLDGDGQSAMSAPYEVEKFRLRK